MNCFYRQLSEQMLIRLWNKLRDQLCTQLSYDLKGQLWGRQLPESANRQIKDQLLEGIK